MVSNLFSVFIIIKNDMVNICDKARGAPEGQTMYGMAGCVKEYCHHQKNDRIPLSMSSMIPFAL